MSDGRNGIPLPSRRAEGLMPFPVTDRRATIAPDPSLLAAGADVAEADPPDGVATYPSVIDAERDPLYGDRVTQENWNGTPGRCEMYCAGLSDDDWLAVCDCFATDDLLKREETRLGRLSRWQEQR